MRYLLYDDFEERVQAQSLLMAAAVRFPDGNPVIDVEAVEAWQDDDNFLRLFSADGELLLDSSPTFSGLEVDQGQVAAALDGETTYSTANSGAEPLGIITAPLLDAGQTAGVVQVGMSRSDVDEVLRLLLIVLAVAAPVVIGASAAGGVSPRRKGAEAGRHDHLLAARMNAEDLSSRLDLDLPDDELGRLATTFDAMLDHIQNAFERQRRHRRCRP